MAKKVRTVDLDDEYWEKISTYQHANRVATRIEAIRQMLTKAYEQWLKETQTLG